MIDLREYITPNTPLIQKIIREYNLQTVEDVFIFMRDMISTEADEWDEWFLPDQTLMRAMKGIGSDCEDKACTGISIMKTLYPNLNAFVYIFFIPERNENHAIILVDNMIYDPTFMINGKGLGTGATIPNVDPFANPVVLWDDQQLVVYDETAYQNLL